MRQERHLSQEELADRAKLNRNYIGMIEREENSPTIDAIEQLSTALNVEPSAFFESGYRGAEKV